MSNARFDQTFELFRREIYARTDQNKRLYSMPIDEALETGEVLGPARLNKESGEIQSLSFQFKFRRGDKVKICILNGGKLEPISNVPSTIVNVKFADIGIVRFSLSEPILDSNLDYFIVMDYNPNFDWSFRDKLMKNTGVRRKANLKAQFLDQMLDGLNSGQQNAIELILKNQFSGVIQGPPGTGKTEVLARLVEIAVANNFRVGILSFTNKAVDNALARVSETITEGVVRVGDPFRFEVPEGVDVIGQFSALKEFNVFGSTTHKFLLSAKRPAVDLIILDEAGQIPSYFLAGIKHACSNIVMIGDHHQLPPIMQVRSLKGCEPDCFSFYKKEQKDLPMLDTQYRMNETIQDWSSKRYYDGKLKAFHLNAKRDIFSNTHSLSFGETVINYHDQSRGSDKIARKVVEYAKEAKKIGNVNWSDIGIISPHRMHASHINKLIQEEMGVDVNNEIFADTVDRFQGREKEFIIFSVSDGLSDPAGFLNDYRRINVAITRAKSRFYVVSDYRPRDGEEFSDFLDWCKTQSWPGNKNAA